MKDKDIIKTEKIQHLTFIGVGLPNRVRPRFFDQVGHQNTNASIGNKYISLNNVIIRLIKFMNRADKN